MAAVADGRAGLASIDCVSFALLGPRPRPSSSTASLSSLRAATSPGLPFIAAAGLGAPAIAAVREALFAALADPNLAEARSALGLKGARAAGPADYDRVAEIERGAVVAGYPRLA